VGRTIALAVLLLSLPAAAGYDALIGRVVQSMPPASEDLQTVAIAGLAGDTTGSVTKSLTRYLVNESDLQVSDRSMIDRILEEQALGLTGVVDPSSATQVGQIAGVDAVLYGSVREKAQSDGSIDRELTLSLVSTASGTLVWTDNDEETEKPPETATDSSETKTPYVLIIVVLAIIIVLIVTLSIVRRGGGRSPEAPTE
jgi:hypothetical protein